MAIVVFVFVGLIWGQTGGMERPVVGIELTRTACEVARLEFETSAAGANAANPYPLRKSFTTTPCLMVTNTSEAMSP